MTLDFNGALWGIPQGGFPNIPEAAVEAAAEWLPHSDDCEVRPERDCTCWQPRVNLMRAALEAAAPHLMAQSWEQGAVAGWNQSREGWNAEYPDESTGKCSVDLAVNPYKQHGNG